MCPPASPPGARLCTCSRCPSGPPDARPTNAVVRRALGNNDRIGYPVTFSDCVDTGPAPAPGNADPTPLNITSVTVYLPGRLYTCVGDWPEPVVPSPNSQRYVITGCALTVPSAEKLTGRPAGRCFGPKVEPGVIPL